jgi:hypothetical protein
MQTENLMYVNVYHRGVCFTELSGRYLYQESAKFLFTANILDNGEHFFLKRLNTEYFISCVHVGMYVFCLCVEGICILVKMEY